MALHRKSARSVTVARHQHPRLRSPAEYETVWPANGAAGRIQTLPGGCLRSGITDRAIVTKSKPVAATRTALSRRWRRLAEWQTHDRLDHLTIGSSMENPPAQF